MVGFVGHREVKKTRMDGKLPWDFLPLLSKLCTCAAHLYFSNYHSHENQNIPHVVSFFSFTYIFIGFVLSLYARAEVTKCTILLGNDVAGKKIVPHLEVPPKLILVQQNQHKTPVHNPYPDCAITCMQFRDDMSDSFLCLFFQGLTMLWHCVKWHFFWALSFAWNCSSALQGRS